MRAASLVGLLLALLLNSTADAKRPNVVLIMTDNHGAWTLGCYGNKDIRTPNIDRLAKEGTLFSRAFSSNPVCSPTRATFLTGLIPSQHGVHCFLRGGNLQVGPNARNTLADFTSLPEILKSEGYACGLVGKWHLGANMSPQEGLDDYWITMPHGGTSTFYGANIIENGKQRREPQYLTDFWTKHAVKYIEQRAKEDKPFFLYLAYNGPYSLSRLLLREGKNRHAAFYRDKELPSFPREPTHPWQFSNRDYINNPTSIRRMATEVSGVDDGVGTVMDALKRHGLDDDTLVIFTADQGTVGGHGGFWGMGDHTRPLTAFDGMMHIPMIWRHPKQIAADKTSRLMVSNYDFLPSVLGYLGLEHKAPTEPRSPGRDFSGVLKGKPGRVWSNVVFYEFENLRCIRTDGLKYVERHKNGPHELYDLKADPQEANNLYGDPRHKHTQQELRADLKQFYRTHASPKYDMWRGGGSQTFTFHGIEEELAQADPAEPPPLPEGFKPQRFKLPRGYAAELVAGPPLVEHPMMAAFDNRGRLFVAESAGLNLRTAELEKQLPNSIRMLEDTDGDGRFDRSTMFADKMTLPMGAQWHDGSLYVASPPNIWKLTDTDDDGVADKRVKLVDGFGYSGNAASVHGCFLGPDGRIYWCDGRHGHEFRDEKGNITARGKGSYIFSCKPDGSDVRPHCGGGMDNPVEVDFTEEGDVIGTVNILYTAPRIDALVHWLHGGTYPHSQRVLGEFKRTGELLGPIYKFGHVAVSGMTRYRSGVLDRGFRDDIFTTIFNTGKVTRMELQREGSTYAAAQHEFLSCDDPNFHPTDVLEDADGSLLVVDTGGWFRIGCPTSQIAKPEFKGAIYRVRREGMTTLMDPFGKEIHWKSRTAGQLIQRLNDTRFKVREQAIAECARRGDAMVPTLATAVLRQDIRPRRNAVWALTRIGTPAAQKAVRPALSDTDSSVVMAACHSTAVTQDKLAVDALEKLLADDNPAICRCAATALGRIADPHAVPFLLSALDHVADRGEEHAIIHALIEIASESTVKGLDSPRPEVRRGALIALDQTGMIAPRSATALLSSDNARLRKAAINVFKRHADWSGSVRQLLADWSSNADTRSINDEEAAALISAHIESPPVAEWLGGVIAASDRAKRKIALTALASTGSVPLHKSWQKPLATALNDADRDTLPTVIAAVGAIRDGKFNQELLRIGRQEELPALLRVSALKGASGSRLPDDGFALLVRIMKRPDAVAEASQAAEVLASTSLTAKQLIELTPFLKTAGPLRLRVMLRPFARNQKPDVADAFLAAIAKAKNFGTLTPTEFSEVVKRYPPEQLKTANKLLEKLRAQDALKRERLGELQALVAHGDAARGRELFFAEKSKCATCHRIGENGGKIGPDLSAIGRIRRERDLLEAIVFPSASFAREYEPYKIVTEAGKPYAGLIVRETADTIFIQQQTGDPVPVQRKDIMLLQPSTVSIMPQGLEKALTPKQLADIVVYLRSLRSNPH